MALFGELFKICWIVTKEWRKGGKLVVQLGRNIFHVVIKLNSKFRIMGDVEVRPGISVKGII